MKIPRLRRRERIIVLVSYWVLLFAATSVPATWFGSRGAAPGSDKLAHGLCYALLAWLVCWTRELGPKLGRAAIARGSFAIVAVYGLFDELHQQLIPTRSMEMADLLADAVGAAAGVCLWAVLWTVRRRAADISRTPG